MADFVARAVFQDETSAGASAAAAALDRFGVAADVSVEKVTRAAASATALVNRFDDVTRASNLLEKAQASLAAAQSTMADAVAAGTKTQEQADAVISALTQKVLAAQKALVAVSPAAAEAGEATTRLAAQMDVLSAAAERAAAFQKGLNDSFGLSAANDDGYAARAADIAAYGAEMDRLRAKYDPLFAVSQQYARQLEEIDQLQRVGVLTAEQAAVAQERLTASFAKSNAALDEVAIHAHGARGATSAITREFVVLGHEGISGNWTRIPGSLVVLGEHMGGLLTKIQQVGAGFVSFATGPVGIAAFALASMAGAGAFLATQAEDADLQIGRVQARLAGTRPDAATLAPQVVAASRHAFSNVGVSAFDVQNAANTAERERRNVTAADNQEVLQSAQTLAASPDFSGGQAQLTGLLHTANNLAVMMGTKLPDATKELADAMNDPASAAQKLADQGLRTVNQALVDHIRLLEEAGNKAEAFALTQKAIDAAAQGATEHMTPLQAALQELSQAFERTDGQGKSLVQALGEGITDATAAAVRGLADVVHGIELLYEKATEHPAGAPLTGAGSYAGTTGSRVLTSSTGALGIMQVEPSNAGGLNLADPSQNIIAGLNYILKLNSQFHGNEDAISGAYNAGPAGYLRNPAAEAGYIANVHGANTSVLSGQNVLGPGGQTMTTDQAIQFWGDSLGMPANLINLGKRIAVVESGGRQFDHSAAGATATPSGAPSLPLPPTPPDAGLNPVVDSSQRLIDQAEKEATGTVAQNAADAAAHITLYQNALKALADQGTTSGYEVDKLTQALDAQRLAFDAAVPASQALIKNMTEQTGAINDQADAYLKGGAAAAEKLKADQAAATQGDSLISPSNAEGNATLYDQLAPLYEKAAQAPHNLQVSQSVDQNNDQLQVIQAETSALGQNDQARQTLVAHIQAEQDLKRQGIAEESQLGQAYLNSVDALSKANQAFTEQKAALDSLSQTFSSAFESIGSAMTNAFVSGGQQAVNWGSVMKNVADQVLNEFLNLSVINPLVNSISGGSSPTIGGALSAVTGGASGTGAAGASGGLLGGGGGIFGGGGAFGLLSDASTVGSISDTLGLTNLGGGLSNFLSNTLGLGSLTGGSGTGGLLFGSGSFLNQVLGTQLIGSGIDASAAASLGSPTASIAATDAALTPGLTIGTLLGGVGLGTGAGTLLGDIAGFRNPTGTTIGSGVGSAAGAAIGSIIPGIGTAIGGLIGGLIGSTGGLFGPGPENSYSSTAITSSNGQLQVGNTLSQLVNTQQQQQSAINDTGQFNQWLQQNGLAVAGSFQIGQNTPGGYIDPTKFPDLAAALGSVTVGGSGAAPANPETLALLNQVLPQYQYGATWTKNSSGQYEQESTNPLSFTSLSQFEQLFQQINTYVTQTIPQLEQGAQSIGSLQANIQQIQNEYAPAIQTAQTIGYGVSQIQQGENTTIANLQTQNQQTWFGVDYGQYATAQVAANATISGSPADAEQSQLYAANIQYQEQQIQLNAQLVQTYGSVITSTQSYQDQMNLLGQTYDAQTQAIQVQYQRQVASQTNQVDQWWYGNQNNYESAQATVDQNPQEALQAQLDSQYASGQQQQFQLTQMLQQTYGDSITSTQYYADAMAQLEKTLGEQRLAIQQQYDDELLQSANSTLTSLSSFAQGLQFGGNSPLSPWTQYSLAESQYQTVAQGALGGNYQDIQQFQSYASNLLSTSRAVYGSGAGYVSDYQSVMQVLQQLASMPQSDLTAAVLAQETQTQTQQLSSNDNQVLGLLQQILTAIQQGGLIPSRIAA